MTRTSKMFIYICMLGLAAFYACSDKETPQPVEDTARVDALRNELRDLQDQVLGAQGEYSADSSDAKSMEAEIERLKSVFAKTVQYTIVVTDFQGNNLADATVKVTQAGNVASAKSDANGIVKFDGLHGGNVSATVELEGFATLLFTADIADYNTETSYAASSRVALLPVGGTAAADKGMSTLKLDIYANYSTQDDTLGGGFPGSDPAFALPLNQRSGTQKWDVITDKKVKVILNQDDFDDVPSFGFTTDGVGAIITIAYENTAITVAAATNGTYIIKVPARNSVFGFEYNLVFEEFVHDYTEYVPGGSILVDKPYDPTITTSKVFREDYWSFDAELPGTTYTDYVVYDRYNN